MDARELQSYDWSVSRPQYPAYRPGELYTWPGGDGAVFLVLVQQSTDVLRGPSNDVMVYTSDGQMFRTTWLACSNDVLVSGVSQTAW